MSERDRHPKLNPEPGHPADGETLPEGSPTAGEAALEKGDVEVDGPKAGKGGHETHGAGDHDDPSN
jgi:hypothetical protein